MGPSRASTALVTLVASLTVLFVAYNDVDTNDTVKAAEERGYTNVKVTKKNFAYSSCGKYYLAIITVTGTDKNGQTQTLRFCAGRVMGPEPYTK